MFSEHFAITRECRQRWKIVGQRRRAEIAPAQMLVGALTSRLDERRQVPHFCRADMPSTKRKNYPHLAQPVGPCVQAVKHNGMLFLSGLTALGSSAQGRGITEQAEAIFKAIASIARTERTDISSLVKVTMFVTSLQFVRELRAALTKQFGDCSPMSSLVQIGKLLSPEVLVEVEAVLAVP
jgi:2-iminobutanoate/2-iminopropanoate deaminase